MKTQILIVSYSKDKPYLEYCLRSIRKFATGFSGTTVVVPSTEASEFASLVAGFGMTMMTYDRDQNAAKWHLHAQAQKCWADTYCPEADFVLHTDSDCVFTEPVTPEDYFIEAKPVMLMESYARLGDNPWQDVVQRVLKHAVKFEFMRRHPQVNPIGVYSALRQHINRTHGVPFEQYVLAQKPTFPWGFTEHNVIGAFAYYHPDWKDKYHWWEVDGSRPVPHEKLAQFWSLAPIDQEQSLPHAGGRGTPLAEFQRLEL